MFIKIIPYNLAIVENMFIISNIYLEKISEISEMFSVHRTYTKPKLTITQPNKNQHVSSVITG